jgi:hypothetical protein
MANGFRRDRDDEFDDDRPSRRDHEDYDDPAGRDVPRRPMSKGVNVCGVIALVLGIVGIPLAAIPCTFFIGLPLAGIGLLLGFIGLLTQRQTTGRGMPIAGTAVSLVGVVIGGIWLAVTVVWVKKTGEDFQVAVQNAEERRQEAARVAEEQKRKAEKELREGKAIVITARKLDEDYDGNPLNADTRYKGKILEVTGAVDRVNRDRFGKAWIEFQTDSDAVMKCEFPRESHAQLEKIEANKNVTIRGRCKGKVRNRDGDEDIVLENCVLVYRN